MKETRAIHFKLPTEIKMDLMRLSRVRGCDVNELVDEAVKKFEKPNINIGVPRSSAIQYRPENEEAEKKIMDMAKSYKMSRANFMQFLIVNFAHARQEETKKYYHLVSEGTVKPVVGSESNRVLNKLRVKTIKARLRRGDKASDIARDENVSRQQISLIYRGKAWKNVE